MSKHDKRKEKTNGCIHRLVMEKVLKDCPEGALEIISTGSTAGTGIAGAQAVVHKLDRELKAIEVDEVDDSELDFDADSFDIPIP